MNTFVSSAERIKTGLHRKQLLAGGPDGKELRFDGVVLQPLPRFAEPGIVVQDVIRNSNAIW